MRSRPADRPLRGLVAVLACVVAGALLHPTSAAAQPVAASFGSAPALSASSDVPAALPAVSGRVTSEQAAAWHLDGHSVTRRTTPGGSTVVFTPNALVDDPTDDQDAGEREDAALGGSNDRADDGADGLVGQGTDFRAKVRWWGFYVVYFNKLDTLRIAAGTAACAAVVKFVPLVGTYLAADCALLSVAATYARARDKCLLVEGWVLRLPHLQFYRGRYCR